MSEEFNQPDYRARMLAWKERALVAEAEVAQLRGELREAKAARIEVEKRWLKAEAEIARLRAANEKWIAIAHKLSGSGMSRVRFVEVYEPKLAALKPDTGETP